MGGHYVSRDVEAVLITGGTLSIELSLAKTVHPGREVVESDIWRRHFLIGGEIFPVHCREKKSGTIQNHFL